MDSNHYIEGTDFYENTPLHLCSGHTINKKRRGVFLIIVEEKQNSRAGPQNVKRIISKTAVIADNCHNPFVKMVDLPVRPRGRNCSLTGRSGSVYLSPGVVAELLPTGTQNDAAWLFPTGKTGAAHGSTVGEVGVTARGWSSRRMLRNRKHAVVTKQLSPFLRTLL